MAQPMTLRGCIQSAAQKPPFSWFSQHEVLQFLMLGLEDAGKTTLLYRLKIGVGGWRRAEIIRSMAHMKAPTDSGSRRDPAYHYEDFLISHIGRYGIWEAPGDELTMRMWPMFYRYLRIAAVLFVVDAFSTERENIDKIARARDSIQVLLNEEELRAAVFVLVLNNSTLEEKREEKREEDAEFEKALEEMLGVPEIEQAKPHKFRFLKCSINCADVHRESPSWEKLLKDIYKIYMRVGEGSFYGRG